MRGQVVDTPSAQEFMRETLARITPAELDAIADECRAKARGVTRILAGPSRATLDEAALRPLLRSVFATRRRVADLLAAPGARALAQAIDGLLDGARPVDARLEEFCERLAGVPPTVRWDLGSELLHFSDPERYWLWTRWIWDPGARTGALPLVTMEEAELDGGSIGATYLRVGEAIAFVHETGRAAGFTRIGDGSFGVDVYLACVYAVYVYTTVRMRMTQEFNRVIPTLPELTRRFLGVWRMEL
jgi:hypothetical protein